MSEGPALYELAAKAMIAHSGRTFALKRHSHRGDLFWDLPGGRLARGDDLAAALRRKLGEEIGYAGGLPEIGAPAHLELWDDPGYEGPAKLIVCFRLDLDPEPVRPSGEHAGWGWLGAGDLRDGEHGGARLEPQLAALLRTAL